MLDKIDSKLLAFLVQNSRESISVLAKKARISRDLANYRINRLLKLGIIRDFTTNIDVKSLGFVSALLFVSISADKESEFVDYINCLDFVSWAGTHMGLWSLGMAIYGSSTDEIESRFQLIFGQFKNFISNHKLEFYKDVKFFSEKYFAVKPKQEFLIKENNYVVDSIDKIILKNLSKNSRITSVELSKLIPLSPPAIANRISKLESAKIILGYSIYINVFKMGLYSFVFFIKNKQLENQSKLYTYLENHESVSMLIDYVGDPFIEFSIFVDDPYKIRSVLQEIKETFPENELVDFFMTQEDFISFGAPNCIFE